MVKIHLPPLRRRDQDIPALAHHFLRTFAAKHGRPVNDIEPDAMRRLVLYNYPGNVRQLRNIIERAAVLAASEQLTVEDLPPEVQTFNPETGVSTAGTDMGPLINLPFKEARQSFEAQYLLTRLEEHEYNITHTAAAVGIHRQSLQQKIKDLDLRKYLE